MNAADRAADAGAGSEAPSFETALARLGQIVDALEKGDLSLERSLALFEEGVNLSRVSAERIEQAEARVEQLLGGASSDTKSLMPRDLALEERSAPEPKKK